MNANEIRKKFLDFFEKRGHKIVPSSSLIPDDPSVLLTTAGMQQFKKYYTGEVDPIKDFGTKNAASIQKSFRTSDIDEVGDESHLTFFEMLGNFSFGYKPGEASPKGGYFKKEAIEYGHDFITKEMGLKIDYVSVFEGDKEVPADIESEKIWKSLDKNIVVKKFSREDNFWGPTGSEGPCGPTTEIYVNGVEIWNMVFNEYYCSGGKLEKLKTPGVDTGMGLERLAMIAQNKKNIFETDLFADLGELPAIVDDKIKRIMLDHCRAVVFLVSDGVRPSNKDRGYILRRLIRRAVAHFHKSARGPLGMTGLDFADIENLLVKIIEKYGSFYKELNRDAVLSIFREENDKFRLAINNGTRELKKIGALDATIAFKLYETFGLTFEIIKDFGGEKAEMLRREDFDAELKKHQEKSRAGATAKFGGHGLLLDTGELKAKDEAELKKVTRLHTATHLLQAALRKVLGNEVRQAGSGITAERTRFDFTFSRKLTPEEIKKTEDIVNEVVHKDLPVGFVPMPIEEAKKTGALYFFKGKYPSEVKVYYVGHSLKDAFSKEFCGGPHVNHTLEIGGFKIIKEETVGAGVRRIRAAVL